jgi:hypothetical protein
MGMLKEAKAAPVAAPETEEVEAPATEEPEAPEGEEGDSESDWPAHLPPEQQDAFEAAVTMLYDVLYKNPETNKAVLDQLYNDEDPAMKVEGAARAAVLLVQQIDEKLNVPEEVMPYFIATVADRVIELAETKGIPFDDTDTMATLAATADGVRGLFGGEEGGEQPPVEGQPPQAPQAPQPGAPV